MSRNWLIAIIALASGSTAIVALAGLLAASFGNNPNEVPSVLVETPAADFSLEDLEGNTVSLQDLRGKPVVLNFWSTWCVPCKAEHPVLLRAARNNRDVAFYGVIYQDEPEGIRRYLKRSGGAFPHLIDPEGYTAISYGVAGVPETFFVNPEGKIVHKQVGPLSDGAMASLLEKVRGTQ